jgi:hypothetical protein
MKTKTFLLLCLFLGIGLTQLSAQNGKNGNGTDTFFWVVDISDEAHYYLDIPVNCDNNVVERLEGTVTIHQVNHFQAGGGVDPAWIQHRFSGELKGDLTDEVFKLNDILKEKPPYGIGTISGRVNLVGNKGSRYILIYNWSWETGIYSYIKAVCN